MRGSVRLRPRGELAAARARSRQQPLQPARARDRAELGRVRAAALAARWPRGRRRHARGHRRAVVFGDLDGRVHAHAVGDGTALWLAELGAAVVDSPCVTADAVFVGDARGTLHALARVDGSTLWSHVLDDHPTPRSRARRWSCRIG
ncbi:MAG: PQQ-binding-like beta-propeller repeat protein [Nannocystaceae bacterium]